MPLPVSSNLIAIQSYAATRAPAAPAQEQGGNKPAKKVETPDFVLELSADALEALKADPGPRRPAPAVSAEPADMPGDDRPALRGGNGREAPFGPGGEARSVILPPGSQVDISV